MMRVPLLLLLLVCSTTWGTDKKTQQQSQDQIQHQGQIQEANATINIGTGGGGAGAQSSSSGQGVLSSSNGDQISMNSSQFYALSLMQPQAVNCFTSSQGGAAGNDEVGRGLSGFLGFYTLNTSCWLQQQASMEQDIHISARLKCGDKKYRNAIAYDVPRKERQSTCIKMKVDSALAQMDNFNAEMKAIEESSKRRLENLQACHARIDEANERTERCFAQFVESK
jgi:hypothetical protein